MADVRMDSGSRWEAQVCAREALQSALREAGCHVFADVKRRLVSRDLLGQASERTYRRLFVEGPPLRPQETSHRALEALASLTRDPDGVVEQVRTLWASTSRRPEIDADGGLRPAWFGVIPRQDGRGYASVDLVEFRKQTALQVSGLMTRVTPRSEAGLRWDFRGVRRGNQGLFLTFWPAGPNNEISKGVMYLRASGLRSQAYEGGYVRMDESGDFIRRTYGWYPTIPQTALDRVALLDLDNTLRLDWSVRPWLEFLIDEQVDGARDCLARVEDALGSYRAASSGRGHDTLASECAGAYAEFMAGKPKREIERLAGVFVADEAQLFSFVRPLIACLGELLVAPVIVSGAPLELVSQYAHRLGVADFVGLTLGVEDGLFDGSIVRNPGVTAVKREVADELVAQERVVVLAVGDSDSDRPLWQAAPNRIVVGGFEADGRWSKDGVLSVDPETLIDQDLVDWVRARVGEPTFLQSAPELNPELMKLVQAARRPTRQSKGH